MQKRLHKPSPGAQAPSLGAQIPEIMRAKTEDGIHRYVTPSTEFELSAIRKTGETSRYSFTANEPSIFIGEAGAVILHSETETCAVSQGATVFVPATGSQIFIEGQGTCYRASLPGKDQAG